MSNNNSKLSTKTLLSYSLPAFPLALLGLTFYVFLPKYYADVIGVPLSSLGVIIILSRIWDALIDPAVGVLSDRTRHKSGRRRPWVLLATLPLCLCFISLVIPPTTWTSQANTYWFTVWTFLFFLFWTFVAVPYEALGAELSFSYDERTKLLGTREAFVVVGTLGAVLFPFILNKLVQAGAIVLDERAQVLSLAIFYSALLVALVLIFYRNVKERNWDEKKKPQGSLYHGYREVLKNKPFLILLTAYLINSFGGTLPATLIFFYVEYVLGDLGGGPYYLIIYFIVGFLFFPLWVFLSRKLGKKESWLIALSINTIGFIGVFFLGEGDTTSYALFIAFSAIGYGGTLAIPASMQADVIDYDELQTGLRREGQFIGLWYVVKKFSAALGAGLAFPILDFMGYVAGARQNAETIFAMRFLYAAMPCICNVLAMFVAVKYPIDKKMFLEIREKIVKNAEAKK